MTQSLSPGFADPVTGAQACFRAVLDAMARPGRIQTVRGIAAPPPLCDAAAAVLLTLVDHETTLRLDTLAEAAHPWIAFHTGAPTNDTSANGAAFVMALSFPDLTTLPIGTHEAPETSATVILQVKALGAGRRFVLQGPGLRHPTDLRIDGMPADFAAQWQQNHALFPRGIDLILCAGSRLAALPRSVTVEEP